MNITCVIITERKFI